MDAKLTLAADLHSLRCSATLLAWLRKHHTVTPVSLPSSPHTLLNPGDDTPLWLADPHTPTPALQAALSASANTSRSGCSVAMGATATSLSLHVALATEPRVESATLSHARPDADILEAFAPFTSTPITPAAIQAFRSLRRRSVSSAFFRDVRDALARTTEAWTHGPEDPASRHALSITLFCRLTFLYFIQARGWLDNDPAFLAALLLDPRADDLYRTRLSPLFFETLNVPTSSPRPHPALPYLNGGLFTPTPLEVAHPSLDLPDDVILPFIDDVLERYRFTPSERHSPRPGAIDAGILGHVFECLMEPGHRSKTGTFYTPPSLVDDCVRDALLALLPVSSTFLDNPAPAPALRSALDALTLLDPAMGSGAFLVGALHRLTHLRHVALSEPRHAAARTVLQNNLYGVDISQTAVTIANLRLWLALTAESPHPTPLPNLAHHLRRGDALLSSSHWSAFEGARAPADLRANLASASAAFASAHGPDKAPAAQTLLAAERDVAVAILTSAADREQRAHDDLLASPQTDLLEPSPLSPAAYSRAAEHATRAGDLRALAAATARGDHTPAFDFSVHFAHILDDGGFDAIIGNPPWVRLSRLSPTQRTHLRQRYATIRNAGRGKRFGAQPDLSVAFVERALQLLNPGGVLSFVLPSKLFTAGYGSALRAHLHNRVLAIRDLAASPVPLFDADVFPATLLASASPTTSPIRISSPPSRTTTDAGHLSVTPNPASEWPLLSRDATRILRQLSSRFPSLSSTLHPRLGIKTGANRLFLDLGSPLDHPVLRGADISPMRATPSSTLAFCHDPTSLAPLPESSLPSPLLAHFRQHARTLSRRADAKANLPPWSVFRLSPDALGHRVVWRDIGLRLEAAYLPPHPGGPLALNTTYFIPVPDHHLGLRLSAYLCSTPARFCAAARAERALNNYRRFLGRNVGAIPLPPSLLQPHPTLDAAAHAFNLDPDSPSAQTQLDAAVASLLLLSPADLSVIQNNANHLSLHSGDLAHLLA